MKTNERPQIEKESSKYEQNLREQRDQLMAENPENAWMIQTAYEITRRPYMRPRSARRF